MANYRQVNTFFWDDAYVEELGSNAKLLFLYLITSPLTNIAGSFEITLKKMAEHTGIPREEISDLLVKYEEDGKCMYRNNWMLVVNTIEHQHWETHATIKKGIEKIILASPAWVLDRVCIAYEWLSYLKESNSIEKKKDGAAFAAVDTAPTAKALGTAQEPASSDAPSRVEARIWTDGVELLTRSGMKDAAARSYLGRLAKEWGSSEDPALGRRRLAEAIAVCQAANPADPKAYIPAVLQDRWKGGQRAGMQVGKHDASVDVEYVPAVCALCGYDACLGGQSCEARAAQRVATV